MIALRIGPDMRMAVVGAPSYFRRHPEPKRPQDLIEHNCINLRLPWHGWVYAWEFEKGGRELKVRVEGQFTFNATGQILDAALAGSGLAYVPESMVQPYLPGAASSALSRTGACPIQGTTSTTLVEVNPRRHSRCSLTRCAIGSEGHLLRS